MIAMKINVVLPTLQIDDQFRATISSLLLLEGVLGRVIVVAPERVCKSDAAVALHGIEFVSESSKGVYACFNQSIDILKGASGYVVFIGAGDLVLGISKTLQSVLASDPEVVMTGVVRTDSVLTASERPEYLFRKRGRLLARLPHHQGMLYRVDVVQMARYPEGYKIYGDVLQRVKALQTPSVLSLDLPFIRTAPAGISSYNDLHRIKLHIVERLRLFIPLIGMGEPIIACRYVAGICKVFRAAVEHALRTRLKEKL